MTTQQSMISSVPDHTRNLAHFRACSTRLFLSATAGPLATGTGTGELDQSDIEHLVDPLDRL